MRERLRADWVSLSAGLVVAGLGALVLLDSAGALSVPLGWMAAALTAALGTVLLLSGLVDGAGGRHD
jgi:peptidoglycan/LPS O-acetylase OafA/YrhL